MICVIFSRTVHAVLVSEVWSPSVGNEIVRAYLGMSVSLEDKFPRTVVGMAGR